MSCVLGNFSEIAMLRRALINKSQSSPKTANPHFVTPSQRCFSASSVKCVAPTKQPTKVVPDLTDGDNGGGGNADVVSQSVPLSYISYEDKSAKKNGTQKKTPLIVHHSLIGSKENWKTVSKEIHHVTKRTVYSVDARNHGDSPHTKVMNYTTMTRDIENFIKQIDARKISFLGHSFGGRIGLLLAMMRPELIDKLVVVDSSPFVNKKSIQRWANLRESCARLKAVESELKECTGLARRTLADKTVESVLTDKKDRALFLSNLITSDDQKNGGDKSNLRLWRVNLNAILENPKLMSEYPDMFTAACECQNLTRFNGKVLFVSGDRSQYVRKDDETSIRALFPNAEFVWFAEAGHWMHVERHAEFMKTVVPYLESA